MLPVRCRSTRNDKCCAHSSPDLQQCTYLLPKSVIKQIDKFRKHYLWRGSDANNRKPPKVAWPMVCVPKTEGGLNESLLLKHLHQFFNHMDIPWVKLVWSKYYIGNKLPALRVHRKAPFGGVMHLRCFSNSKVYPWFLYKMVQPAFFGMTFGKVIYGAKPIQSFYSFCQNTNTTITIQPAVQAQQFQDLFHLPLSQEAHAQFLELSLVLQNLNLLPATDNWTYIWGSPTFSSNRAYKHLIGRRQVHQGYHWLWKSSCQNKRKFFFGFF